MDEMRALGAVWIRTRPILRGMKLSEASPGHIQVQLRIAGHTRWEIQRDARKLITMLMRRAYLPLAYLELELVTTERNGRELYAGEGRTPMTKTARSATKPDGRPWDHHEWWGDVLPMERADHPGSRDDPDSEDPTVPEVAPWLRQDPATESSSGSAGVAQA